MYTALSWPENTALLDVRLLLMALKIFLSQFLQWFLSPGGGDCYRFRAGHFIASYFSAQWPLVCFCINHHLLHKEAVVMKAERFINSGSELGPILDLQLCPKPVRSISYLFNFRTLVFTLLLCPEHSSLSHCYNSLPLLRVNVTQTEASIIMLSKGPNSVFSISHGTLFL